MYPAVGALPTAWVPTLSTTTMNGMSRFLSRREKHQEKRASKHANKQVRHTSFASVNSLSPLLRSPVTAAPEQAPARQRRLSGGIETLYHKLPFVVRMSVEDSLLFLCQKLPIRILSVPTDIETSPSNSSDHSIPLQSQTAKTSPDLYRIFSSEGPRPPANNDVDKKVKMLLSRLQGAGISSMGEQQAEYALAWQPDDLDRAYDLLVLANESFEGELKEYNPAVTMLGAINRNMVTCYLDALLFAMFARLDSFEAMLYDNFEDEPRKKLAAVLRLWVNLLRSGELIKVGLTKHLQDSLAKCGWEDAAEVRQQDASEAFTFITGVLELPLLTLKMDIYHTGREDKEDDHKFVNERLLEVAIPEQEGDSVVTLEDCLETYFNNRIEVKRYLQRQNTIASMRSRDGELVDRDPEKNETMHIETVELDGSMTPLVSTPVSIGPPSPLTQIRPGLEGRRRADSIFTQRYTRQPEMSKFDEKKHVEDVLDASSGGRPRSASLLKKEILMPAWQFFSLIPWYTDNVPRTDAQVAAHFSVKRPVLGICLKRYTMTPNGSPKRLDTYIDIPLDIGLPHFISDDRIKDEGPLFGNFKLVLQSVVCHRGVSVDSGHYIALVRANTPGRPGTSHSEPEEDQDKWLRFDDLSNQRVVEIDIRKALREESPYLLFYQVQPIDEELASRGDPPAYEEAQSEPSSVDPSSETLASLPSTNAMDVDRAREFEKVNTSSEYVDAKQVQEPPSRNSISSNRASSVAIDDTDGGLHIRTELPTPDEQKTSFLPSSRRGSRIWIPGTKSRSGSPTAENRLSITLSRLTGRGSRDKLVMAEAGSTNDDTLIMTDNAKDVDHSSTKDRKDSGIPSGKIKKEKKDRLRSKSRDPAAALEKGKHKDKSRPDRECVVM
ncbi:ubiquitin C-terminal hydrolase family [Pyrenophora seminiperda CCB06]|uniref:ubiquitinyl hydrolase 1 n=1 Tax=Pyrenophora seminiperda CCB06 TaxID=1302712 RepID=A0A3M7M986_9PLEO|nr:ubiquitin C-terminal hydrolase family [Pyrenophora seminiperda CCB06]